MQYNHKDALVLYNQHTLDGQAAAVAANGKLRDYPVYLGVDYATIGNVGHELRRRVHVVYILGLHLTETDLKKLSILAEKIVCIDRFGFESFTYNECFFQSVHLENRSACAIAWAHFHPNRVLPRMFEIIEDVELSIGNINNSTYAYYGLQSSLLGLTDDKIFLQTSNFYDANSVVGMITDGFHYYNFMQLISKNLLAKMGVRPAFNQLSVGILNCPKVFNRMLVSTSLKEHPMYLLYEDNNSIDCSPRATRLWTVVVNPSYGLNASSIAVKFGGFGSELVAGFMTTADVTVDKILETWETLNE